MGAGTREAEHMARQHEAVNGEEPQEGLQIERYTMLSDTDGQGDIVRVEDGPLCLFSDAEKWFNTAQDLLGKNLILSVENEKLRDALEEIAEMGRFVRHEDTAVIMGEIATDAIAKPALSPNKAKS